MNIPSRLSQPSFERFRQIIQNAADLGRTVEVTAAGLASSTLAARLRDALLSYRKFHWGDEAPRAELCALSVYTDVEGRVYLGTVPPKNKAEEVSSNIQVSAGANQTDTWTLEELKAVCLLISNKRIAGDIKTSLIPDAFVSTLELDYDIAISSTTDASIIF